MASTRIPQLLLTILCPRELLINFDNQWQNYGQIYELWQERNASPIPIAEAQAGLARGGRG